MSDTILVVGLGNPGATYAQSRHNIGFAMLDLLAEEMGSAFSLQKGFDGAEGRFGSHSLVLVKPLVGMNLSGKALIQLFQEVDKMIVIYDDLDMEAGRVRIKKEGSGHGGHNGVKSIIECVGGSFDRIKIGIGRPQEGSIIGWVLTRLQDEEWQQLTSVYPEVKAKLQSLLKDYESVE